MVKLLKHVGKQVFRNLVFIHDYTFSIYFSVLEMAVIVFTTCNIPTPMLTKFPRIPHHRAVQSHKIHPLKLIATSTGLVNRKHCCNLHDYCCVAWRSRWHTCKSLM